MPADVFLFVVAIAQCLFSVAALRQVRRLALQIVTPGFWYRHPTQLVRGKRLFACRPVERVVHVRHLRAQPQHERRRAFFEELNRFLGVVVLDISFGCRLLAVGKDFAVVVSAVRDKEFGRVESALGWRIAQMPFAHHARPVACVFEVVTESSLVLVKGAGHTCYAGGAAVSPRQTRGPAGAANRQRHERLFEPNTPSGQRIDIWRVYERVSRAAHGIVPLVVGQNEDEVGPFNAGMRGYSAVIRAGYH